MKKDNHKMQTNQKATRVFLSLYFLKVSDASAITNFLNGFLVA